MLLVPTLMAVLPALTCSLEPDAAATGSRRKTTTDPTIGRNAVVLSTSANIPNFASSLAYHHALGRHVSLGGGLEYHYQPAGYWHLQGIGETLSTQVWLRQPFKGMFAEASMTIAHQFLGRKPGLSTTALVPGLGVGLRWTHKSGLTLGGLRWGHVVAGSPLVCTRPEFCHAVRAGAYAQLRVDIGFVF